MKPRRPKPPDYEADPPDFKDSPLYWLAVLAAARKSKDRLLEWHARRHLTRLGTRVVFDDEPHKAKGGGAMSEATPPLALRPREAAKALGISERTLWQWTHEGRIPCVRFGSGKRKTVLYPVADLQAWLAANAERSRQAQQAKGGGIQ